MQTAVINNQGREGVKNAQYSPLLASKLKDINSAVFFTNCLRNHLEENLKPEEAVVRTIHNVQVETALSRYEQETAIKKLKDYDLLNYTLEGMPSMRHFKINFNRLAVF